MKRSRFRRPACAALLLALPLPVSAETLADAVAEAYAHNPQLESQRAQLRSLDENWVQATAPYRLSASLDSSAEWSRRAQQLPGGDVIAYKNEIGQTALSAQQILMNGGRTAATVSATEADILAGREQLRQAEQQILLDVVDAYAAVIRDAAIVDYREQSVAVFRSQLDQSNARFKAGDLTRTDIGQATAQLATAQSDLDGAQAQLESSRGQYATLVGHAPGTLATPPALAGLPSSITESYAVAGKENPALWQSILTERAGRARVAAARAERHPVVSLQGSYGYFGPLSPIHTRDYERQLVGSVNVTVPIYQGGQLDSQVRQAEQNRQAAESDIETERRAVELGVLQAWNQVVASTRQLAQSNIAVDAATLSSTGARKEYGAGLRSTFEVLNEEQRLLDARVSAAQASYAAYTGQAALLSAVGRMQAARIVSDLPNYDPDAYLQRLKRRMIWPLQPVAAALDKLAEPSDHGLPRPTPQLGPSPAMVPAENPIPGDAPLSTALPLPGACPNVGPC